MVEKSKTKEEFIKFFDREIKRMDNEITKTLKNAVSDSAFPVRLSDWNYEETYDTYVVNVKLETPDIKVSRPFEITGDYLSEKAEAMGIPEEWLGDREFNEKFRTYLVYETISELLPDIKSKVIDLGIDLKEFVEKSKEKLEEVS
jgi:hypothetical protein